MTGREGIGNIQFLAGFNDEEIDVFVNAAERRTLPADSVIFRMGDANESLFIICTGSVKIERPGTVDDIPVVVLETGQTFGEMSFMDGSPTTATATAVVQTEVLEISRNAVDHLLAENPDLGVKLWRNLALDLKQRLAKTNEMIDHYVDMNQVLLDNPALGQFYGRL